MRRGSLTATAVRTRGGYPKPQTIRTAPTRAGNKRPTTRTRAARHAPDPTTREVRADDQPFARLTRDKKPDRITRRARTRPARPSWSCPARADEQLRPSHRRQRPRSNDGRAGGLSAFGHGHWDLVASAVRVAASRLSVSERWTLCTSVRAGDPFEQPWRCEGSMISPVISVMPSWAIVISSNAEASGLELAFDDEAVAVSNIHSEHAWRRPRFERREPKITRVIDRGRAGRALPRGRPPRFRDAAPSLRYSSRV